MSFTPAALAKRRARFLNPDGSPRHVYLRDNGGATVDRYTVVYKHAARCAGPAYRGMTIGRGMSGDPFHPQGFGQWFEVPSGRFEIARQGRPAKWANLPPQVQRCILQDYNELWSLNATAEEG